MKFSTLSVALATLAISMVAPLAAQAQVIASPLLSNADGSSYMVGKISAFGALGPNSITIISQVNQTPYTVIVAPSTLYNINLRSGAFGDLRTGMLARIIGTWHLKKQYVNCTSLEVGSFVGMDTGLNLGVPYLGTGLSGGLGYGSSGTVGFGSGLGLSGVLGLGGGLGLNLGYGSLGSQSYSPWLGSNSLLSTNSLSAFNFGYGANNGFASNSSLGLNNNLNSVNITKNLVANNNASYLKQNSVNDHLFALNKINSVETKVVNGINLVKQDHVVNNFETAQQSAFLKDFQNGNALNTATALQTAQATASQNAVNKNTSSLDTDSFFKFKSPFIW